MVKTLTKKQMKQVIEHAGRCELEECPKAYLKAIRVTLVNLGYDQDWITTNFTPALYEYYDEAFRKYERRRYENQS